MERLISYLDEMAKVKEKSEDIPFFEKPETTGSDSKPIEKDFKIIKTNNIHEIGDLTKLIIENPYCPNTDYNIHLKMLHDIYPELCELENMVGMNTVKSNVLNQILYFLQGLHKNDLPENNKTDYVDYKHIVLVGPPGTGKTELAKILGKLFLKLSQQQNDVFSDVEKPKGIFKKVTRNDLVGGYLGQTAIKTKEVIQKCLGGVLFIDEAYSLNNNCHRSDSFAKECIDILCESLSFHRDNLMVIIAGYEAEMTEFLKTNEGLESRFIWRYRIEPYNSEEMACIFLKMCDEQGWYVDYNRGFLNEWFEKNRGNFKSYGRDVEKLLTQVKIKHSRRIFNEPESNNAVKKRITIQDMEEGYTMFLKHGYLTTNKSSFALQSMYI